MKPRGYGGCHFSLYVFLSHSLSFLLSNTFFLYFYLSLYRSFFTSHEMWLDHLSLSLKEDHLSGRVLASLRCPLIDFQKSKFCFPRFELFLPWWGGGTHTPGSSSGAPTSHHPRRCSEWSLRPNVNFRPFLKYRGWPLWSNLSLSSNVQQEHVYNC